MNNYEKEYSITNMLEEEKIMFEKLKEKYVFFDIDGTLSELWITHNFILIM